MEASFAKLVNRTVVPGSNVSLWDAGYRFANLDDGWQACHTGVHGSFHSATGEPLVNTAKFPNISAMTDKAHALGLKPGFYFNNYICNEDMPPGGIGGSEYLRNMRGSAEFLARLRFEYVKIDSGSVYNDMDLWHLLIAEQGSGTVIENCHQGDLEPNATWCPFDLWRTSGDAQVVGFDMEIMATAAVLGHSRPGCWAYADTVSVLRSVEETRAQFGVYAIMSSPLLLSFDILSDAKLLPVWEVLTNPEVISVNQQWAGSPGRLLRKWATHDAREPLYGWAEPCNVTEAAQQGWSYDGAARRVLWRPSGGSSPLCLAADPSPANPQGALALKDCGNGTSGGRETWQMEAGRLWEGGRLLLTELHDVGRAGLLQARACDASRPGQRWRLSGPGGATQQQSVQNELPWREGGCWEITGCVTGPGAEVGVNFGCKPLPEPGWTDLCLANGAWTFNPNGTITSVMDRQCLQVDPRDNATVNVEECSGGAHQTWAADLPLVRSLGHKGLCVDSGVEPPPAGTTGRCVSLPDLPDGLELEGAPLGVVEAAACDQGDSEPPPLEQRIAIGPGGRLQAGSGCVAARHGVPTPFGPLQLWAKPQPGGAAAVLVLSRAPPSSVMEVNVPLRDLPLQVQPGTSVSVRDLWARRDSADLDAEGNLVVSVSGLDSAFFLLSPRVWAGAAPFSDIL